MSRQLFRSELFFTSTVCGSSRTFLLHYHHEELIIFKHFSFPHAAASKVAPNVTMENEKSLHVLEGSEIAIECVIEASPRPVRYWIKEPLMRSFQNPYDAIRQNVLQDSERMSIVDETRSLYRTVSRLKISNFGENDVGAYSCVVSNMMGRANSTVRLFGESSIVHCAFQLWLFSSLAHTLSSSRELWREADAACARDVKNF